MNVSFLLLAALLGVTTAQHLVGTNGHGIAPGSISNETPSVVGTNGHGIAPASSSRQTLEEPPALPVCGDVNNCFDCFLQQECVQNPFGGEPICSPCGWCASNSSKKSWYADVTGECVMAPIGIVDFCQLVDPGAERYCPEDVCKVGDWGCACKDNMCPAIEKLIGIFTIEGLWIILICIMSFGVCLATLCLWCVCGRRPRQIIIVHQYPLEPTRDLEQQSMRTNGGETRQDSYARFN